MAISDVDVVDAGERRREQEPVATQIEGDRAASPRAAGRSAAPSRPVNCAVPMKAMALIAKAKLNCVGVRPKWSM